MQISVAITTHDYRWDFTRLTIGNLHNDKRVAEIVLVDDHSDFTVRNALTEKVKEFPKVKFVVNDKRLLVWKNKYKAVSLCNCDRVVLLDSDNVFERSYLDAIEQNWQDDNSVLCPDKALPRFDFSKFDNLVVDKTTISQYIQDSKFSVMLNTGNYCISGRRYLDVLSRFNRPECNIVPNSADVIWTAYHLLSAGMRFKICAGMEYQHNVHAGSTYYKYKGKEPGRLQEIIKATEGMK